MSKCIAEQARKQTAAAFEGTAGWSRYTAFFGLDVHKETIAVAVALPGRDEPQYREEIKHEPKALQRWLKRLNDEFGGAVLLFCYEAGPCGYGLYRQLTEAGHECQVVHVCYYTFDVCQRGQLRFCCPCGQHLAAKAFCPMPDDKLNG